ncbi:MAG: ornithine carbamoyltransferase [Gaiellaceae bacterium]
MTATKTRVDRRALAGKDYIETFDWSVDELDEVVKVASELKEARKRGTPTLLLQQQTIYLLFLDKSTRTRNAFETGMTQLGGHAIFLDADKTQVSHGESPKDTGIMLSRYGEGIAIRHDLAPYEGSKWMREVAAAADIPVINMQCDIDHPTQTIADLMTLREQRGESLKGLKVAMTWAYAPSYARPLSVPQGVATLFPRFGMDVVLAYPPGFDLMPESIEKAKRAAEEGGGSLTFVDSMDEAFEQADVVYPKSWGRLDAFGEGSTALAESIAYEDWICDERRIGLASPDVLYMHCLPADRGREVTDGVIDGPHSIVWDEAENRMHTAKALMALTMGGYR